MATHSSNLAWKISRAGEPVGCSPWSREESDTTEATQQQQKYADYLPVIPIGNHVLQAL